jgi:hypothetical protein
MVPAPLPDSPSLSPFVDADTLHLPTLRLQPMERELSIW